MRVEFIAGGVARHMGLAADQVDAIELVAIVHDIGKLAIPTALLAKPGALTDQEYALMKSHSVRGEELLIEEVGLDLAAEVRVCHERWDGGGYPDGLSGEQIPLASRIIGASDALDAMLSSRAYRAALPFDEAIRRMREQAGRQFDPAVVEHLIASIFDPPWPLDEALEMLVLLRESGDRDRYLRTCARWVAMLRARTNVDEQRCARITGRFAAAYDDRTRASTNALAQALEAVGVSGARDRLLARNA